MNLIPSKIVKNDNNTSRIVENWVFQHKAMPREIWKPIIVKYLNMEEALKYIAGMSWVATQAEERQMFKWINEFVEVAQKALDADPLAKLGDPHKCPRCKNVCRTDLYGGYCSRGCHEDALTW